MTLRFDTSGGITGAPIAVSHYRPGRYRNGIKRTVDVLMVLLLLPVVLPLMGLIALALWIEDGNPFYAQDRLGRHGQRFRFWKFRTMVQNADTKLAQLLERDPALKAEWARSQKLRNDPRITRLGAVLRGSSMDELPQLFNVLRGDMSLVGPRPMMPEQLALYGPYAASYFALRPGLTGLWQVSERNDADFARRAELDAQYERMISFTHDSFLLLATLSVVWRGTGY